MAVEIDYDRLAFPTGLAWKNLPTDSEVGASKLRQLVLLQRRLIIEHNKRGVLVIANELPFSDFRREQLGKWNPQLGTVGQHIALLRRTLPLVKPDPNTPETWYRYQRWAVMRSLAQEELQSCEPDHIISGEVGFGDAPDPYVDFSPPGYTETDPGNDLSVDTTAITFIDLPRNLDSYIYKSHGAGHFTDLTGAASHDLTVQVTWGGVLGHVSPYILSNTVDDRAGLSAANAQAFYVGMYGAGGGAAVYLGECEGGDSDEVVEVMAKNTDYDFNVDKNGTAIVCKVYTATDPSHQHLNLLHTLDVTLGIDRAYEYHFGVDSVNTGGANEISGISKNHDLHEAAAGHPWYYYAQQAG